MAKKKLLNEATVRRFMGLAGMDSTLVSNKLNEMNDMEEGYGKYKRDDKMEEELHEEEEPMADEEPMDDMGDMGDEPMDEPAAEGELNIDEDAVMKAVEAYDDLGEVMDMLKDAVGGMGEEEPMDDMGDEEPMDDMGDMEDEEPMEEPLEEVELQLSEDEIVQEVVNRVTKRILKAKAAKKQLDEALGRNK